MLLIKSKLEEPRGHEVNPVMSPKFDLLLMFSLQLHVYPKIHVAQNKKSYSCFPIWKLISFIYYLLVKIVFAAETKMEVVIIYLFSRHDSDNF